jgi:hypothetical protein
MIPSITSTTSTIPAITSTSSWGVWWVASISFAAWYWMIRTVLPLVIVSIIIFIPQISRVGFPTSYCCEVVPFVPHWSVAYKSHTLVLYSQFTIPVQVIFSEPLVIYMVIPLIQ